MATAKADTIDSNLEALRDLAVTLLTRNSDLATEVHRVWVDLSEGIADLRQGTPNACDCDQCDCKNTDDDGNTCEDCFRDCLPTEGGE